MKVKITFQNWIRSINIKTISWFLLGMIFNHIFISLIFCTFLQLNFFTGWFLDFFYLTRFYPVDFQKQIVNWSIPPPLLLLPSITFFTLLPCLYDPVIGNNTRYIIVIVYNSTVNTYKIEKLLDWNKNWCGSRYWSHDYDSGDKKTKRQKDKKD